VRGRLLHEFAANGCQGRRPHGAVATAPRAEKTTVSADELAVLADRGWIRSTMEGMWEHPDRVGGPVSLPEALEIENDSVDFSDPDEPE
jgi:hypothetical protein